MGDAIELTAAMADMGAAMEVFASLEKFASMAGVLGPIAGVAGLLLGLAMGGGDSEELAYMKEQFTAVKNKLDVISDELGNVLRQVEKSTLSSVYFPTEMNLKNQFRKYMEIISARSDCKEKEKDEFITHFNSTKGDQNLHTLYEAIMGHNMLFAVPILETAMSYSQKNRRVMEQMCARLKTLFCIGLIALLGQTTITGNDVDSIKKEWDEKISKVEEKMKTMVDRCVAEFLEQAKIDVEAMIKANKDPSHAAQVCAYHTELANKYDWLKWSVVVYDDVGGYENHNTKGENFFYFYRTNGINCVVSYSKAETKVDRNTVLKIMDKKFNGCKNATDVVTFLKGELPGHLVQAIRRFNGVQCMHDFPWERFFWKVYDGVTLCVHTE